MARYMKVFPVVEETGKTDSLIRQYLTGKGFQHVTRDGETVFQKGKGVWVAPSFVKVTYYGGYARLEAWIDAMGSEQGLEGFVGCAAKRPLKKVVTYIEGILTKPGEGYVPAAGNEAAAETGDSMPVQAAFCSKCGTRLENGNGFCSQCGYIAGEPIESNSNMGDLPAGVPVSRSEYLKKYAGDSFKNNLRITAIVGYVLCGIQALTALVNPYVLLDLAICLGLTLGMHLGRSKGCAIGIVVYSVVSMVLILLSSGTLGGWGWLVIGICALIIFNNAEKRYKELTKS